MHRAQDPRRMALVVAALAVLLCCADAALTWKQLSVGWNIQGDAENQWNRITPTDFTQRIIPALQQALPAAQDPWVQPPKYALTYDLWMSLNGRLNATVTTNTLKADLLAAMMQLYPTGITEADVNRTGSVDADGTVPLLVAVHTSWINLPNDIDLIAAGLPYALKALPNLPNGAAIFANNFTMADSFTQRLTNLTATFIVPGRDNQLAYIADNLQGQLVPTLTLTRNSSSWALNQHTAVQRSDVTAALTGFNPPYDFRNLTCKATSDSCCGTCGAGAPSTCVPRPICVPTNPVTLEDMLCMANGPTPCNQRGPRCVPIADASIMADALAGRGFPMGGAHGTQCVPLSAAACLSITQPSQCTGGCRLSAICKADLCLQVQNGVVSPIPCCGASSCETAPLPATANGVCGYNRDQNGTCQFLQQVSNCSAPGLTPDDKALCETVAIVKTTATTPITTVASSFCLSANICSGSTDQSAACTACKAGQGILQSQFSLLDAAASACGSAYPPEVKASQQLSRLRSVLKQVLPAKYSCNVAADALMPSSGPQLLSADSLAANTSLSICQAVTGPAADMLCGEGDCSNCVRIVDLFKSAVASGSAAATKAGVYGFCFAQSTIARPDSRGFLQVSAACSAIAAAPTPPPPADICGASMLNLCSNAGSDACRKCTAAMPRILKRLASVPVADCSNPSGPGTPRFDTCGDQMSRLVMATQTLASSGSLLQMFQQSTASNATSFCQAAGLVPNLQNGGYNMGMQQMQLSPNATAALCIAEFNAISNAVASGAVQLTAYNLYSLLVDAQLQGSTVSAVIRPPQPCNPSSDACCAANGLKPATPEGCTNLVGCNLAAKCSVVADSCYSTFTSSSQSVPNGVGGMSNAYVCPVGCTLQTGSAAAATMMQPMPALVLGSNGPSVVQGVCVNSTQWSFCSAKATAEDCDVYDVGRPICAWAATCQPAPSAPQIGCEADPDSCCVSSPTATFTGAAASQCVATTGGSRKCRPSAKCMLRADPCDAKTNPIDCAAISTCQYVTSGTSGKCVTLPTANPCAALGPATCSQNPMCQVNDRCVTDTCDGGDDRCCRLPGGSADCSAAGCSSITSCRPTMNKCAGLKQDACTGYCSWQAGANGTTGSCYLNVAGHPCATTAGACTAAASFTAGGESCMLQSTCVRPCARCTDCLSDWDANLKTTLDGLSTVASLASAARDWCLSRLGAAGADQCTVLAQAVQTSKDGNFAKRPGAVCRAIGDCRGDCLVPVSSANSTKVPLDLCTANGRMGGTQVPVPNWPANACKGDADCASSTPYCTLTQTPVCFCRDGMDICQVSGSCNNNLCDRIQANLATINARFADRRSCAADADCNVNPYTGFKCQPAAWSTYTCTGTNTVTATNFTGMCVEQAPKLLVPTLSSDTTTIEVTLSAIASPFTAQCSTILTAGTLAKVGADAVCAVGSGVTTDNKLVITLMNTPNITWGTDVLTLKANQALLVSAAGNRAFADASSAIASCGGSCPPITAVITGPASITKPCPNSSGYTPVFFSAANSKASAAGPINSVTWTLTGAPGSIAGAVTAANSRGTTRDKMAVVLTGADLTSAAAGSYRLTLQIGTALGQSANATYTFTVADPGKPSVTVNAVGASAGVVQVVASKGLRLLGDLRADSVCPDSAGAVQYTWSATVGGTAVTLPATATSAKNLRLDPVDLLAFTRNTDYIFTLSAQFRGVPSSATSSSMTVRILGSPLYASLRGHMGIVPAIGNLTFSAADSKDPDDQSSALTYTWTCQPAPCFKQADYTGIFPDQGSWIIDASKFTAVDQDYTIQVSVNTVANGRTAVTAFRVVTPKQGNPPTGTIVQSCGLDLLTMAPLPCPPKQNRDKDTQLYLTSDRDVTVTWSIVGGPTLQEGVNAKGINRKSLTVFGGTLPQGTVTLAADMTAADGAAGRATISLVINTPPFCPDTSCFSTDVATTTFPAYTFTGSVAGWTSASGDSLSYEYGVVKDGAYSVWQPASATTTYVFKGFSPGTYQLYACAVDTVAARGCQTASITVNPPAQVDAAAVSNAVSAVTAIDTDQLLKTGDPTAVAAKMMEVASLSTFAASAAATSNAQVATLAAKKSELLTTLTAVMDKRDPAAMANSLAAAAAVSTGNVQLSPAAGGALLDVVDGLVSASSSTRSSAVSTTQVTSAANLVVKGIKAMKSNSGSPPPAASHKRSLRTAAAASLTSVDIYNRLKNSAAGVMTLTVGGSVVGSVANGGSTDLCSSVLRGAPDSQVVKSACAAAPSSRRHLLDVSDAQAAVNVPSDFTTKCAADTTCSAANTNTVTSSYESDASTTTSVVQSWPDSSLLGSLAVANTQLTAVSGVLTYSLGPTTSGAICSNSTCNVTLTIPVSSSYSSSLGLACVRLDPLQNVANYQFQVATTGISLAGAVAGGVANCTTSYWGKAMLVQYTAPASSSPAPQQGAAAAATKELTVDNSTLAADQAGTPIDYTFRFANYDYKAMFIKNGVVDTAAMDSFKLKARKAFLAGVSSKTSLNVSNNAGALQLARVTVNDVREGSVIVDLTFTPPPGADLTSLNNAITTDASTFFATSDFVRDYGQPEVTGTIVAKPSNNMLALGVGIGVGLGGALLVGVLAWVIIARRRRQTLAPQEP